MGRWRGAGGERVRPRAAPAEREDQREGEEHPAEVHLREGARRKDQLRLRLDRVQRKVLQGEREGDRTFELILLPSLENPSCS